MNLVWCDQEVMVNFCSRGGCQRHPPIRMDDIGTSILALTPVPRDKVDAHLFEHLGENRDDMSIRMTALGKWEGVPDASDGQGQSGKERATRSNRSNRLLHLRDLAKRLGELQVGEGVGRSFELRGHHMGIRIQNDKQEEICAAASGIRGRPTEGFV
jgi:hypothetical protein